MQTKIIDSKNVFKTKDYISVSYVWKQFSTDSVLLETLTIADSIITRKLLREPCYWLDRYSNKHLNNSELQKMVRDMRLVYQNAMYTLALIPEVKYANMTNLWNIIHDSLWMSRCWTLQEQLVSNTIILAIDEVIVDITDIVKSILYKTLFSPSLIITPICVLCKPNTIDTLCNYVKFRTKSENGKWQTRDIDMETFWLPERIKELTSKAKAGQLSALEVTSIMHTRIMGVENVGYEPAMSLMMSETYSKNVKIESAITERLNLSCLLTTEKRCSINGYCWRPERLNVEANHNRSLLKGVEHKNGHLEIFKVTLHYYEHDKCYLLAGHTNSGNDIFLHLVRNKIGKDELYYWIRLDSSNTYQIEPIMYSISKCSIIVGATNL